MGARADDDQPLQECQTNTQLVKQTTNEHRGRMSTSKQRSPRAVMWLPGHPTISARPDQARLRRAPIMGLISLLSLVGVNTCTKYCHILSGLCTHSACRGHSPASDGHCPHLGHALPLALLLEQLDPVVTVELDSSPVPAVADQ